VNDTPTLEREFTVASELGLHARPAGQFVQLAGRFSAEITVSADGGG
jgi:phosphocarrier protein